MGNEHILLEYTVRLFNGTFSLCRDNPMIKKDVLQKEMTTGTVNGPITHGFDCILCEKDITFVIR